MAVRMRSFDQEIKHVKQVYKLRFSSELSPKASPIPDLLAEKHLLQAHTFKVSSVF